VKDEWHLHWDLLARLTLVARGRRKRSSSGVQTLVDWVTAPRSVVILAILSFAGLQGVT